MRQKQGVFSLFLLSPSSRRAWIEMQYVIKNGWDVAIVALLAEGVDRNHILCQLRDKNALESLSSRRAWIEICSQEREAGSSVGRSPRGGRG